MGARFKRVSRIIRLSELYRRGWGITLINECGVPAADEQFVTANAGSRQSCQSADRQSRGGTPRNPDERDGRPCRATRPIRMRWPPAAIC